MTDIPVGYYNPQQAKLIWETVKELRSSGLLKNRKPEVLPEDPKMHQVKVYNTSGEEIPEFACMQITGTRIVDKVTYLDVTKPTSTDGKYIFNYSQKIPVDDRGIGHTWGIVRMLAAAAAEPLKEYGATVDAWTIQREEGGPFTVYGDDALENNIVKGRIAATGGGGTTSVRFTMESPYGSDEANENCADQTADDSISWRARVIAAPCGVTSVPDMDENYLIDVTDPLGWLEGREAADIAGKSGTASYRHLIDDNGYEECRWEIDMINMFRTVINLTDVIDTGTTIDIHSEQQSVWTNCKLPVEQIFTTDCEDATEY